MLTPDPWLIYRGYPPEANRFPMKMIPPIHKPKGLVGYYPLFTMGILTMATVLINPINQPKMGGPSPSDPWDTPGCLSSLAQAAKTSQAHDFIENLPKGYDTQIGDGKLLSGGRRCVQHHGRAPGWACGKGRFWPPKIWVIAFIAYKNDGELGALGKYCDNSG